MLYKVMPLLVYPRKQKIFLVYTKTTSIRNNFFGILIPEINKFGKRELECYNWGPTKYILAQARSATYKSLQARKKK